MKKSDLILKSLGSAFGVFVYILAVVSLLSSSERIFEETPELLGPIFMLLLFVISASITGLLVLGKPILLYLEGFKKEAIKLFLFTIVWLLVFLIILSLIILI